MTRYLTAIGAATLTLGTAAYMTIGGPGVLADHALRPDDSRLVALGSTIYVENCASCHGARWKVRRTGAPEMPTAGCRPRHMTRQAIHGIILTAICFC